MYCVKCGVRLDDSLDRCPLCGTPVWRPDAQTPDSPASYSRLYPVRNHAARIADAAVLTVLLAIAALISLIYCLRNYGAAAWSGYVMLGIATAYVIFVLPLWLRHPNPVVLIPIAHAAIGGYLLYISCRTGAYRFAGLSFEGLAPCCAHNFCAFGTEIPQRCMGSTTLYKLEEQNQRF